MGAAALHAVAVLANPFGVAPEPLLSATAWARVAAEPMCCYFLRFPCRFVFFLPVFLFLATVGSGATVPTSVDPALEAVQGRLHEPPVCPKESALDAQSLPSP